MAAFDAGEQTTKAETARATDHVAHEQNLPGRKANQNQTLAGEAASKPPANPRGTPLTAITVQDRPRCQDGQEEGRERVSGEGISGEWTTPGRVGHAVACARDFSHNSPLTASQRAIPSPHSSSCHGLRGVTDWNGAILRRTRGTARMHLSRCFCFFTRHSLILLCAALVAGGLGFGGRRAQGLILNLPKDGAWVRFEGTVKQVEFRPEAPEGDISMEWIEHLTLKSVGQEEAVYNGKKVPCRWVEIKVLTGKPSESGVETGPVGERIYKILVPEVRVVGAVADAEKIPFSFLDIVKGYRKIAGNVTPIPLAGGGEGAFQAYPLVGPLMHFDTIEPAGGDEQVQVPGGAIKAKKFKARRVIESPTVRTTCEAEFWRSDAGGRSLSPSPSGRRRPRSSAKTARPPDQRRSSRPLK